MPSLAGVHSLQAKLEDLEARFLGLETEPSVQALEPILHNLERVVLCEQCHLAYRQSPPTADLEALLDRLQQRAIESFSELEKAVLQALLYQPQSISRYLGEVSRSTLGEAEFSTLDFRSRVLFVGCGALPISCHILSRHFGCLVVGIDCAEDCIDSAREFSKYMGHTSRLSFATANGHSFEADNFTHILVASLVREKQEILSHLAGSAPAQAKIIMRYGEGLKRLVNYELPHQVCTPWNQLCFLSKPKSLYDTLLLSKSR